MTQITAIIENGADADLIRKVIENVKGVLTAKIISRKDRNVSREELDESRQLDLAREEWLRDLNRLYEGVNRDAIDMNDERTRYILSK